MIESTKSFIRTIKAFNFKDYENLQALVIPLKNIVIRDGYVLDGYMCGTERNGAMKFYVRKKDSKIQFKPVREKIEGYLDLFGDFENTEGCYSAFSDDMYIKGTIPYQATITIPSIFNYIEIPFLSLPIWEAYLLELASFYLPKIWHGCYGLGEIIYDKTSLANACKNRVDYLGLINDDRIIPNVIIKPNNTAAISFCYWTPWGGLIHALVEAEKVGNGVRFGEKQRETLLEYNCGIRF